ncbi:YoaK family protein [Alicyclobacillus fodiniaquatilis]|uniref:YoaK family protein n=1 Tax=Alicyclobacillus fodiniaquatilis TaxID=1661150 RepID=A0ABW4JQD2_9BACL
MLNPTARNIFLVMLTMTSGCVDAISFLALGQVFTAAMTGNTVLFGLSLSHADGLSVMRYAVALLGFMLGAAVGAAILIRRRQNSGWSGIVTATLCMELAALVLFVVLIYILPPSALLHLNGLLILILSFAMGVQGVAARRIGVNAVTTTVITSTLTGLVETLVWKAGDKTQLQNHGDEPNKRNGNTASVTSILMWISVIVFYGVGAGICGVFELHFAFEAIWLPIGLVAFVLLTDTVLRMFTLMRSSDKGTLSRQ